MIFTTTSGRYYSSICMTAHPKVDVKTGETFAYRYNITRPFLTIFRIDPEGRKQKDVHVHSLKGCTIIHDFSVTENFCVFVDTQIVVNPLSVLRPPVGVDRAKVPRVGVIGKYAEDDSGMWWMEAPGLNMFHSVNAWEEEGGGGTTIVAVVSNALRVEELFESIGLAQLRLEKITIDVNSHTVHRQPLSTKFLDFGVINPAYAARKNRNTVLRSIYNRSMEKS
ncbi:hypothetical protein MIMGU_mgv11b015538mg [Erythranthe guttata]|uniref:Uncharacterized protein n=1 Tax=Erythranthe guttata TaxID=4155 RepID=A0A022PXJ3_ERYGU|nr:hypothetical protein MIMGU_mgv11b015538mg [Erythranthe guttata]